MIRRWLIAVLGGYLAFACCGCSWLRGPDVAKVLTQSEEAQTIARKAVADASKAFADALALVPEANRDAFKARFDEALAVYVASDGVLTSTRTAIRAAAQPKVDYAAALSSVVDAIRGVLSVVEIVTAAGPTGAAPGAQPDAHLAAAYRGLARLEQ